MGFVPLPRSSVRFAAIADAWNVVLRDLWTTTGQAADLEIYVREDERNTLYVGRRSLDTRNESWVYGAGGWAPSGSKGFRVVQLVAEIQDAITDSLLGLPHYWPLCPGDGSGLHARLIDDVAVWVCPEEPQPVAPIGFLGDRR